MIAIIILLLCILSLIAISLVYYYSHLTTPWLIRLILAIGWSMPLSFALLLPLDLTSTLYQDCEVDCAEPSLYLPHTTLSLMWRIYYWIMFALTTLVIPFIQAYSDSGYFTVIERVKKALRVNFIYYSIMAALGVIILLYLLATKQMDMNSILGFAMAVTNLINLSLSVLFLSFGVMQVPRIFWHLGDRQRTMRYLEYDAVRIKDQLNDAEAALDELEREVKAVSRRVRFHDDLRVYVDIVMEKIGGGSGGGANGDAETTETTSEEMTITALAKLHKDLIRAIRTKERYEAEWNDLLARAFLLQDIIALQQSGSQLYEGVQIDTRYKYAIQRMLYVWYVAVQPLFYRLLGILFGIMSILVVWSNVTYIFDDIIGYPISIIGTLYKHPNVSYSAVEFTSLAFLMYMCACSINALFRFKLFNIHSLGHSHHTATPSLCWFTNMLCKLSFPLCYNFTNMASGSETAFSSVMGQMNIAPIIGDNFQSYVPILIAVICVCEAFDLFGRLSRAVGYGEDIMTSNEEKWGSVEDGRILLQDARSRQGRREERLERRTSSAGLLHDRSPERATTAAKSERKESLPKKEYTSNYILNNPLYEKYRKKREKEDTKLLLESEDESSSLDPLRRK